MENTDKRQEAVTADSYEELYSDRRSGKDRRKNLQARFKYFLINGRREVARREEDRNRSYFFDRYNQRIFAAITAILMLSIFDALLTLILIERGSSELNPVMAYFIEHGALTFIIAKYILTSFGVVTLLIFKNVFIKRINMHTHSLFGCIIFVFSTVIVWELLLLISAP